MVIHTRNQILFTDRENSVLQQALVQHAYPQSIPRPLVVLITRLTDFNPVGNESTPFWKYICSRRGRNVPNGAYI